LIAVPDSSCPLVRNAPPVGCTAGGPNIAY
jgi:hypothetical protein